MGRIRRCNFDDAAELLAAQELQRSSYEVEALLIGSRAIPGLSETAEQLRQRAAGGEDFWGWFDCSDGRLAGLIATEQTRGDDGRAGPVLISRLAVDPARFRRGIGRTLVRHVIEVARCESARGLRVSTGAANAPGRALYESEGFVLVGERLAGVESGEGVGVVGYERV